MSPHGSVTHGVWRRPRRACRRRQPFVDGGFGGGACVVCVAGWMTRCARGTMISRPRRHCSAGPVGMRAPSSLQTTDKRASRGIDCGFACERQGREQDRERSVGPSVCLCGGCQWSPRLYFGRTSLNPFPAPGIPSARPFVPVCPCDGRVGPPRGRPEAPDGFLGPQPGTAYIGGGPPQDPSGKYLAGAAFFGRDGTAPCNPAEGAKKAFTIGKH